MPDIEARHPNGLSYTSKRPRPGQRGGFITVCQLRREVWTEVHTPTYEPGMSFEDAKAAWLAYLDRLSRIR